MNLRYTSNSQDMELEKLDLPYFVTSLIQQYDDDLTEKEEKIESFEEQLRDAEASEQDLHDEIVSLKE